MKLEDVQAVKKDTQVTTVRLPRELNLWMKNRHINLRKLIETACEEMGYEEYKPKEEQC